MYEGNFECEALKNTKMKMDQTSANRCQQKPLLATGASAHVRRAVHKKMLSHGRIPVRKTGTKYHHAPSRCASLVRKRVKCSWIKKKPKNSVLLSDTAMNHGAAIVRKIIAPPMGCNLRHKPQSRCSAV